MSRTWLTPEEIEAKRERNKKILFVSLPLAAIVLGGVIPLLLNL